MDKKLLSTFNEQIKNELYSEYLYLSMSAYFESVNLPGFSHWMKKQAGEERVHGMKMFDFLCDRGERVILEAIPQPPIEFSSAKEVFEETLKHEKKVTALINNLYNISVKVNDQAAMVFLQWFITEQVEEEKNPTKILGDIKMIKPDSGAILILDRELAKRE